MKIMVLGGSGNMGQEVVRTLLLDKGLVERVTVADINLDAARRFVERLGNSRAAALRVDVTDQQQSVEAMKEHDLVLNSVGPFYRYVVPVARAAIEARVNYMDICDDVEPTIELLQLDRFARNAGIFILVGMGASPGMTNLRAKALAEQMDEVEEIVTAWVVGEETEEDGKLSEGLAAIEHMLHAITGAIVTFHEGRRMRIPAFREGLRLSFSEPLGPYTCYHVAHPEVVTLPYVIPGVRTVSNLGSLYPPSRNGLVRLFATAINFRLLSIYRATRWIAKLEQMEGRTKKKETEPMPSGLYISCIGAKNGSRGQMHYSSSSTINMAEATGQPLACVALYIASGGSIEPGVHPPETALTIEDVIDLGTHYELSFVKKVKEEIKWSKEVVSAEKIVTKSAKT